MEIFFLAPFIFCLSPRSRGDLLSVSCFALIYSEIPLSIFVWPFLVLWRWAGWFSEIRLQIPFTLDLFRFALHPKPFVDSAKFLKIPKLIGTGCLLLLLSFLGFSKDPSPPFWLTCAFLSALSMLRLPKKKEKIPQYKWTFPTELYQMIAPPLLRKTYGFQGKKLSVEPPQKPHVIFLFLESFRSKNVGCLGGKPAASPHFDRLAEEGLLFTRFHANGLQTNRAIISSLFGIPAHIKTMSLQPYCNLPLIGLPEILKENGYQTALIQGSHTAFDWTFPFFKKHGFETIIGKEDFPTSSAKNTSWGVTDEVLVQFARDWLGKQQKPTFLSLFTISNHHPWECPMKFPIKSEELPEPYQRFLQTFAYTDHCLGQFMKEIKNTVVFIFGDHGQEMGERHSNFAIHNDLYQENIHVPLLIHGVGKGRVDTPASQVDLLPTVLDLLNIQAIHHSVGRSLLRENSEPVFFSLPRKTTQIGCINGSMKAIGQESYNLSQDPEERNNLGPSPLYNLAQSYYQTVEEINDQSSWAPKSLEKIPFEIKAEASITDDQWRALIQSKPPSPIIDLSEAPLLSDRAVFAIGEEKGIYLHELNFSNSFRITDQSLMWASANCPNLKIFNGSHCPLITEAGIKTLLESCPHLGFLNLEENNEIVNLNLLNSPSHLNALHLKGCCNVKNLSALLHYCPRLEYLAASLEKTEKMEFFQIALKELVYLWLTDGNTIHDAELNQLIMGNPNLSILILENFPHIESLNMGRNSRLNLLKFSNCPNLTDGALESLSEIHLKDLSLISCPKITEKGLKHLKSGCKVVISNCPGIKKEAIEMMAIQGLNIY